MPKCNLCGQELGRITETHLWHKHKMHFSNFIRRFPNINIGPMPWNKGETKRDNLSLLRLSNTLKQQKEWNFSKWQRERKKKRIAQYKELSKDENLAELIGIILGDGCLERFPRTERLRVICNSKERRYILYIANLMNKKFMKTPKISDRKNSNATDISVYQCGIAKRLKLPTGNKIKNNVGVPSWIKADEKLSVSCLKGLFETDGCFVVDELNYTRIIEFKNNCRRLREDVYSMLSKIGYHPQFGRNYIRLARKKEVFGFKELIDFRNH